MTTGGIVSSVIALIVGYFVTLAVIAYRRKPKFVAVLHLRPGMRVTISGPLGTWIIAGLETAGDEAKLHLVSEVEWDRRRRS